MRRPLTATQRAAVTETIAKVNREGRNVRRGPRTWSGAYARTDAADLHAQLVKARGKPKTWGRLREAWVLEELALRKTRRVQVTRAITKPVNKTGIVPAVDLEFKLSKSITDLLKDLSRARQGEKAEGFDLAGYLSKLGTEKQKDGERT